MERRNVQLNLYQRMNLNRHIVIRISLIGWMLVCFGTSLLAQEEQQRMEVANQAYTDGNFQQALEQYEALYADGFRSVSLYYNLGNAHYKMGHIAPAILNYERALKVDPSYEDAAFNLRLANLRVVDNLTPVPQLFLIEWFQNWYASKSASQWASVSIWLIWLALALGAVFLFVQHPILKRIGFFGGILLVAGALITGLISFQALSQENTTDQGPGIIFSPNAYVKDAPNGNTDLLILHEGVKIQMEEQIGDWIKISLKDANIGDVVGFVEANTVEKI